MITEEIKQKLIQIFCSKDKLRVNMRVPNDCGELWCATDAHLLAMIPHEHIGKADYSELKIQPILEKYDIATENPIIYSIAKIADALKTFQGEPGYDIETSPCKKCNGEGSDICDMGHEHDCQDCDGDGSFEISRTLNGMINFEGGKLLKISHGQFRPEFIHKIVLAAELLGLQDEKAELIYTVSEKDGILIKVGFVKFVVMPVILNDLESEIVEILPE